MARHNRSLFELLAKMSYAGSAQRHLKRDGYVSLQFEATRLTPVLESSFVDCFGDDGLFLL